MQEAFGVPEINTPRYRPGNDTGRRMPVVALGPYARSSDEFIDGARPCRATIT
ncbi:hypothetical protein [Nocardia terpenica]|uniref:hypothetical protein n=1 Tax=Nocardia terpenica TaxID=455432 RepID=UPI0012FD0A50|nr:hypothetical protein [Nocardia terpenica]